MTDYAGNPVVYTADSSDFWTSTDKIEAIKELAKETTNPTEDQIKAANEGDLTAVLEKDKLADGFYTLTVKLTDKAGNESIYISRGVLLWIILSILAT